MEFPHINDTKFPHLNNVDVYHYQNVFDYSRWQGKVSIKLLNVLWNSNYADVPGFATESERDAWFDAKEGASVILESGFNITPENTVKIPIPYNDAYRFNYMVVDMPMQTSVENPIDYESENTRVQRWYYFVDDMTRLAPNTTEFLVSLDVWTTFYNTVDIPYLMLERGHAPMMQTTVDEFLANPIANNEYLLADDFNFGNDTVITDTTYVPINSGKKYVLFFMSMNKASLENFVATDSWGSGSTNPTFSNESAYPDSTNRWGYQYKVDGYDWHYGSADYSDANLPIKTGLIQSGIMSGLECFAIDGDYAYEFFNEMAHKAVHFIHAIQATFVLAENMFQKSDSFAFMGYTLYIADRLHNHIDLNLSKALFDYPTKYAEITKLYTSPYAVLEVTDDYNNTFTAKIENVSSLRMYSVVSLVYPFLNFVAFVTGIGGSGSIPYSWQGIGSTQEMNEYASDFDKFMFSWNVPTYSLFVSAEQEKAANEFADIQARRQDALVKYHNAVRYADNARENVVDSMDTYEINGKATNATANSNTKNMATVAKDNAYRSSNANKNNADDSADTAKANSNRTEAGHIQDCATQNAAADAKIDDYTNGGTISPIGYTGYDGYLSVTYEAQMDKLSDDCDADQIMLIQATGLQQDLLVAQTINNIAGTIAGGVTGGILSGASAGLGGAAVGGMVGGAGGLVSAVTTGMNTALTITNLTNISGQGGITYNYNQTKFNNARQNLLKLTDAQKVFNRRTKDKDNEVRSEIAGRWSDPENLANPGINRLNATATQSTIKNNAARTNQADKDNADDIKTQTDTNADLLKTTNDNNVTRTTSTEKNNATYTRNATVQAAKDDLRQKQREIAADFRSARLRKPVQYGVYAGDGVPDAISRRGVRFNIRTQTKAAIAQAGDAMLRFGYALHRVWDMSNGLHYCKKFTFWKAEDIWINEGEGLAGNAVNIIGDIFLKGVTVWRNPDEIGKVSIYDNI